MANVSNAGIQSNSGSTRKTDRSVEASPNEPLRMVVYRMAEKGITRMPVVEPSSGRFLGLVSLTDLLKARTRHLEEEVRREQVISLRFFLPGGGVKGETETPAAP